MFKLIVKTVLLLLSLTPLVAEASSVASVSVTPALKQLTVKEGSGQTGVQFKIGNNGANAQSYKLQLSDFMADEKSNDSAVLTLDNPNLQSAHRLTPWATIDKTTLELAPGSSQIVTVRINDDRTLLPGGHYGALLVSNISGSKASNASEVSLQEVVSGLIFLTKSGGETYGLNLTGVQSNTAITESGAKLALLFQNTGNVHLSPRGIARVYDPSGNLVSQGAINADSAIILPKTNRTLLAVMRTAERSSIPGKYRLTVQYRRDGSEIVTTSNLDFYYAPPLSIYAAILLLLAILTPITGLFYSKHKRRLTADS